MVEYDLVVRGGTVATATDTMRCDVGIVGEKIAALGEALPAGKKEIDATGRLVLPGGVDTHVHVEQRGNTISPHADDFFSATVSAACGGTTTIVSHARQVKGESLKISVDDYTEKAKKSVIDYAFHMLVTDPTKQVLEEELPRLIQAGHTSIKFFTTSARNVLIDDQIVPLMAKARSEGAFFAVHAENEALANQLAMDLVASGKRHPKYIQDARPAAVERETVHRMVAFSEMLNVPLQIFHVTSTEAIEEIERAQRRGIEVYGETCVQYLLFTGKDLDRPAEEAVRFVFGPPPRNDRDTEDIWNALRRNVLNTVSSDHVPTPLGGPGGKLESYEKGGFATTLNGIPGLETRLPLLYSLGVHAGKIDLNTFVALTATNPAKMFGLYPQKGSITIGGDADLVVWDPQKRWTVRNAELHHRVDYTPYEAMEIVGAALHTLSRGELIVEDGEVKAERGRGRWIKRVPSPRVGDRSRNSSSD